MKYSSENLRLLLREIGLVEQENISDELPRNLYTNNQERILRVLSWLTAAEKAKKDDDFRLMCALAAFNGLYAVPPWQRGVRSNKTSDEPKREVLEHEVINNMIDKLIEFDKEGILLEYLKNERREELEQILANQYLFFGYWQFYDFYRHKMPIARWMKEHGKKNEKIEKYLADDDVAVPLKETMYRIWVLRNQLVHGEAGYKDYYNRSQINECAKFLPPLVGRMLRIMIDNTDSLWGDVPYPPQGDEPNAHLRQFMPLSDKKRTK